MTSHGQPWLVMVMARLGLPLQAMTVHGQSWPAFQAMAGRGRPWPAMALLVSLDRPRRGMTGHGLPWLAKAGDCKSYTVTTGHGQPWLALAGHVRPWPLMASHGWPRQATAGHGWVIARLGWPWAAIPDHGWPLLAVAGHGQIWPVIASYGRLTSRRRRHSSAYVGAQGIFGQDFGQT